jgi:hypothetical protein
MTVKDIMTLLNSIPEFTNKVAYRTFKERSAPALPFICFYVDETDNFKADDKAYLKRTTFLIELYTAIKSPATEELIEAALDNAGIPWDYTESFIDSENCYQITYEVEV